MCMFNLKIKAKAKIDLLACNEVILKQGDNCKIVYIKSLNDRTMVTVKFKLNGETQYYGMTDINNFIIDEKYN